MRAVCLAVFLTLVLVGCAGHATSGDGWRLVYAADAPADTSELYTNAGGYAAATGPTAYSHIWAAIAAPGEPPAVDFAAEFVAMFAEGRPLDCEMVLQGVQIVANGKALQLLTREDSGPLGGPCSLTVGPPAVFMLALRRDRFSSPTVELLGGDQVQLKVDLSQPDQLYMVTPVYSGSSGASG
jgi:hypothetical protein